MNKSGVSYCINSLCKQRENSNRSENCSTCGLSLLYNDRYRLIYPVTKLELPRPTEVFEAEDKKGKHFIVKVLRQNEPTYSRLFQREAAVLRQIRHPGIPRVYASDLFKVDLPSGMELYAFAMEKIQGNNLKSLLDGGQLISSLEAVGWLEQLVKILHYLHGEELFHRDIKPSNIILRPDGTLALIDFGGVRPSSTDTYLAKVSSGDVTKLGSSGYTPNEQWHGRAIPQSDIYALGWTIISLLTGREPFDLPIDEQSGKPQWKSLVQNLDRRLGDLLEYMTDLAPAKRPKNTDELLASIGALSDRRRWPYSKLWTVPAALVFGLISFGGYFFLREFRANFNYAQAVREMDEGDQEKAKDLFRRSIKISPSVNAYRRLAFVCSESNDTQCAIQTYKQAIHRYPDRWKVYFELADLYDELQKEQEAEHFYEQAIAASPDRAVKAYNNLARIKIIQKDLGKASRLINIALNQQAETSTLASLKKNLGWAQFISGDFSAADESLKQSIALDDSNAASHCLRAQVLEQLGQEAKPEWRRCTNLFSSLPEVKTWQNDYIKRLQS